MWRYIQISEKDDVLYHHGIKGMKWGVRRYQNKDGTLTPAGKLRYLEGYDSRQKTPTDIVSSMSNKKFYELRSDKIGGGEEIVTALLATALTVVVPIAYAKIASSALKNANTNRKMKELESAKEKRDFRTLSDVPKMEHLQSPEKNMKEVNPSYPNFGSTMNCTFCTTAMVMREKGYNVNAKLSVEGWPSKELFEKTFNSKEVKMNSRQTKDQMVDALSSLGDNAYGNLIIYWKNGGGHSVFWKNVNGKVHIYDGQNGEEYDVSNPSQSKFLKNINLKTVSYNRLDNCEPTEYALALIRKG